MVLPAATWGEKTGCFTNADRTVHLSERAVEPPGEARADLDIFLDYARRMDFRDRDGEPLIAWHDPAGAFEAWKACSKGRPCDYSGLSYDRLRDGPGIQWPCTAETSDGSERLYADGVFNTDPEIAETYGQDLVTGAPATEEEYRAKEPHGRAFLHAAEYQPVARGPERGASAAAHDRPDALPLPHAHEDRPRRRSSHAAAPDVWVELSAADAAALGSRRWRPRARPLATRRDRGTRAPHGRAARASSSSPSTTATGMPGATPRRGPRTS